MRERERQIEGKKGRGERERQIDREGKTEWTTLFIQSYYSVQFSQCNRK